MKRWDIINGLIAKYKLTKYLEIGVFNGENFNKINCEVKHSVDPNFQATFKMTSDEFFFIQHDLNHRVGYDLIFIDGLHTADQTYDDLCNAFDLLRKGGFIVVHDCNPLTEWHTRPVEEYKRGEEWNGTTYQGFIRFVKEYNFVNYITVDTDYGCGIISYVDFIPSLTWDFFDANRVMLLNLIDTVTFKNIIDGYY